MISTRLRELLDRKGITAAELARRVDLSKQTIQNILHGTSSWENLRARTVVDIAKELDTTLAYLLHGAGPAYIDLPESKLQALMASYLKLPPDAKLVVDKAIETFSRLGETSASYKL